MTFAERVLQTCREVPDKGRFHDKAWLHAVWAVGKFGHQMSLDDFKAKLWEAHQRGEVELSRCDLVEACDPYDVKRSTYQSEYGGVVNFIRIV